MEFTGGEIHTEKTFMSHVFSTTEENNAEVLNTIQYAVIGVIPIVVLNKLIQRFIPEADTESSSLELLVEIFMQITLMFCGIIIIHRIISYIPTYSGFKYENLTLTNAILAFLIVILSIQTKLGIKVNLLYDRAVDLWNGESNEDKEQTKHNNGVKVRKVATNHTPSQSDYLDNSFVQPNTFPPAPVSAVPNQRGNDNIPTMSNDFGSMSGPIAANGALGGSFGSSF
jgi:hypothetical protein